MGIIAWIVLGLVAGVIANALLGGKGQHNILVTILVGIGGSLLGGWAAAKLFNIDKARNFFDLSTWVIAIIGAAVLLLVYQQITGYTGRRSSRGRTSRRRVRR
jgi:uncharacterized membrane protein YeaQ/YmgE (transglycosylase-associated protein family)